MNAMELNAQIWRDIAEIADDEAKQLANACEQHEQ